MAESGLGLIHGLIPVYDFETRENRTTYKPIAYGTLGYRYQAPSGALANVLLVPVWHLNSDGAVFFPLIQVGLGWGW